MADKGSENVDGKCETLCDNKEDVIVVPYTWTNMWRNLIWRNVITMVLLNVGFLGSVIMYNLKIYLDPLKWATFVWIFVYGFGTSYGVTAGVHRFWTHRTYKANLPLRVLLMIFYSASGMYSIYYWVRDHRVHHKYTETDADPHNSQRGFLFSHIGWLCMKRHPECIRQGRKIDMSDIEADPVAMFHEKYILLTNGLACLVLPSLVPILFWEETILNAVITQCVIRYMLGLHFTWSVNSFAHLFGNRPYNRFIKPAENLIVSLVTSGEGSHNYHHTFPWDYKAAELPYLNFNSTTLFIRAMAKIGWAYDLREPSAEQVQRIIERIGYKSAVKDHTLSLKEMKNK